MADFPSNVSTETSSPAYQNKTQGGNSLQGLAASVSTTVNMFFLRSIPAILMLVEVVGDAPKIQSSVSFSRNASDDPFVPLHR